MIGHLSAAARALASRDSRPGLGPGNSHPRQDVCHNDAPAPVVSYSIPVAQAGSAQNVYVTSWEEMIHDHAHIVAPY